MNNENSLVYDHSVIHSLKESISYVPAGIVSRQVVTRKTGNVTLFAFDQGQKLSEHSAPFDALVQIIDGKAEIIIDKKPYTLTEGQFIIMPANIPHAVNALSKFKMMLVMIKE